MILTDGEAQDVFRGRQSKSELSGVMTDDLQQATDTPASQTDALRNTAAQRSVNATAAVRSVGHASIAVTCLSISRRAYLMLGSCKVMAGLLLEKNSLKIRLMMPSKPLRISCKVK